MGCRRPAGHFGYRSQPKRDSPVTPDHYILAGTQVITNDIVAPFITCLLNDMKSPGQMDGLEYMINVQLMPTWLLHTTMWTICKEARMRLALSAP